MTEPTTAPGFPESAMLDAFFRLDPHSRVPVSQLAQLLAASERHLHAILSADGLRPRPDSVPWGEAAAHLFDAWPLSRIVDALGSDLARRIPADYHPVRVSWAVPRFIIRAIEHQAALARVHDPRIDPAATDGRFTSSSVDDYVAAILFNEIQPATVAALGDDSAFIQAYFYPPIE